MRLVRSAGAGPVATPLLMLSLLAMGQQRETHTSWMCQGHNHATG